MIKMIIFNGTNKWSDLENWLIGGGGTGGALAPSPGKISWLGRTEMRALQDRNWTFAGQKCEDCHKNIHFASVLVIFVNFLQYFPIFSLIFACFSAFISHIIGRTVWQSSLAQQLGSTKLENLAPPLAGKNVSRKVLNFAGWNGWHPLENDRATPMNWLD